MSSATLFKYTIPLISGILFGLGLAISGMTDTNKVLGFLDLFGRWDPSLAFVMGSGLSIAIPGFYLLKKRQKPKLTDTFSLTEKTTIDSSLIIGSAWFGVGWGLYGWCPGPAIASLSLAPISSRVAVDAIIFIAAMLIGMVVSDRLKRRLSSNGH